MHAFGIDIGGSGIKAAQVDTTAGRLLTERFRLETPRPATPRAVAETVDRVVAHFPDRAGPVGATFPAVIKSGTAMTAANVDKAFIGTDVAALLAGVTGGGPVLVVNDADAAGQAEVAFGAARDRAGVVVVVTLGTGIGSALFLDGVLVPNTELGHLEVGGEEAEKMAADSVREHDDLSWKKWAKRVSAYLTTLEALLWPDLIVVGGGVSKKAEKFLPLLKTRTDVVPAQLQNDAGIVGAALLAAVPAGQAAAGCWSAASVGTGSG